MMGLTSLSAECILSHLNNNKRFDLFDRCPQIRPVDRRVPLKLDYFHADDSTVQIDSTTYKIGVVRHYLGNVQPPSWARNANAAGGIRNDYGICAFPNDERVSSVFKQDRVPSIEEKKRKEDAEKKLLELLPKLKEDNLGYIQKSLEIEVKVLQMVVREYKEQLAISELKYTSYIRLTKIRSRFEEREHVLYQFPIEDAVEYMVNLLLRGRKIYMKPFTFNGNDFFIWPERLQISVSTFEYEIKFTDRNLVSIEFPTKNARFENFFNVEFKATSEINWFQFEVKENDLEQAILNILNITETSNATVAAVKDNVQKTDDSHDFWKSFGDYGSRFTIKKIRNGKLPSTRGDYIIEIKFNCFDIIVLHPRPRRNRQKKYQRAAQFLP